MAIAIPVFTTQLEKSRESTDIANVRSAYAEAVTSYLTEHDSTTPIQVEAKQTVAGWQGDSGMIEYFNDGKTESYNYSAVTAGNNYAVQITVNSDTGVVTPNVTQGS